MPLSGIGLESAGMVEAVGPEVVDFAVGDRVGCGLGPIGAYATRRNIAADMAVSLRGSSATKLPPP